MRVRIVLFICVAALATGCEKSTETAEKSANDPAASSANHEDDVANPRELLLRMAAAYAEADSYFDRGMLRLSRTLAGETTIDDVPFSVKFERPNRVRIEAYQVVIASDGNRLVAKIFDEATNEMDHQALVRPAPKQIDAETLYLDPQQADPILAEILVGGIVGLPPTLEMLLAKEAPDLTQEAEQYVLGVDDEIDGRRCRRLVYQTPNGALTMFVDADNYLLRRVEYPQKAMLAALQANDPNARISLVADFVDAAVDDPIHESEFLFNIPATDKKVTYFVRPPQRSTSDQLGSQPPTFAFESLTGEEESSADFVGAPTILAWINDHPSSRLMTEQLTRFAADASTGVQIKLVSVDPSDTTSELVAQRLEQWGANFAAYRDVHAVGRQQFRIPGAPTLLLLDAEGKVQFMEAGAAPDLAERLWTVARRLAQGEDVAAATLAAVKAEQKLYQAALTASMAGKNPYRDLPLPSAKIAPASELSQFDSQLVWTSGDIEKPGAVAVLHDSEERRIFVLDDGQAVCELSPEGKLISRHALELGDAIKVDRIRVAASDQGVRVAVFSADGQHLWLLDDKLESLYRYPANDASHAGIADVQLLSGAEQTTLVAAFHGEIGAHGVDESGKRLWSFRELPDLRTLAVVGVGEIAVMDASSRALVIDRQGQVRREITLPRRSLLSLAVDPVSNETLALALAEIEMLEFDALDKEGAPTWSYPFPAAELPNLSPWITPIGIGERRAWCGISPDGSLHVMQANGAKTDRFSFGEMPTGLGSVESGDLIVALPDRVVRMHIAPVKRP